jgi:ribonuclease HII
MILPKTKIEKELQKQNKNIVIGVDEAGRGPLAGPVVAGAVWVNPGILDLKFESRELIRDSKSLSEKQRQTIHDLLVENELFLIGVGKVSHQMIDRLNILGATMLAMRLATEEVIRKVSDHVKVSQENVCVLIDGNRKIPKIGFEQRIFSKGDRNIFSIAAASIIAKVHRDKIMKRYHKKYPEYGFESHKGYGTKLHMQQIQKIGPCEIHRRSFGPIRNALENVN